MKCEIDIDDLINEMTDDDFINIIDNYTTKLYNTDMSACETLFMELSLEGQKNLLIKLREIYEEGK